MISILIAALLQDATVPPELLKQRHHPNIPRLAVCDPGADAMASTLAELPAEIAAELRRFFDSDGGLADAGGAYNSTDVIDSRLPMRRFLRAYHARDRWIVWYERGGFTSHPRTLVVAKDRPQEVGIYRPRPNTTLGGDLCLATRALLGGVHASTP